MNTGDFPRYIATADLPRVTNDPIEEANRRALQAAAAGRAGDGTLDWSLVPLWTQPGWTGRTGKGIRRLPSGFVELRFQLARNGGTLTSATNGNLPDQKCSTIQNSSLWPSGSPPVTGSFLASDTGDGLFSVTSAGEIILRTFSPGSTITNGKVLTLYAIWGVD